MLQYLNYGMWQSQLVNDPFLDNYVQFVQKWLTNHGAPYIIAHSAYIKSNQRDTDSHGQCNIKLGVQLKTM